MELFPLWELVVLGAWGLGWDGALPLEFLLEAWELPGVGSSWVEDDEAL